MDDAQGIDEIVQSLSEEGRQTAFLGLREALPELPEIEMTGREAAKMRNGRTIKRDRDALSVMDIDNNENLKMIFEGTLVAMAKVVETTEGATQQVTIKPWRVFRQVRQG